jgi:hypothetical protein
MAELIVFMAVDFSLPAANVVFASDAQGAGGLEDADCGGYGIVAADVDAILVTDCWRASFAPGKSVTKLDGSLGTRWSSRADLDPTVPFTRLPSSLFKRDWTVLAFGRWRIADHITLGEGRAHVRISQALAAHHGAHGHRILCLEDNSPVACAMTKERSTAPSLNFLVRRRAAANLAGDLMAAPPWIQTSLQPADDASRNIGRPEVP